MRLFDRSNLKRALVSMTVAMAVGLSIGKAQAAVIFSNNFNSETQGLSATALTNFTVTSGSVDVIPVGSSYDFYPDNGNYIDLEGSTGQRGVLQSNMVFGAGTYTLSFNLGGIKYPESAGYGAGRTTIVTLGNWTASITLPAGPGVYTSQSFTVITSGGRLVFQDAAHTNSQNVGNILDNVSVAAVPEPSTWALMLLGFAGLGYAGYRKKKRAATAATA